MHCIQVNSSTYVISNDIFVSIINSQGKLTEFLSKSAIYFQQHYQNLSFFKLILSAIQLFPDRKQKHLALHHTLHRQSQ